MFPSFVVLPLVVLHICSLPIPLFCRISGDNFTSFKQTDKQTNAPFIVLQNRGECKNVYNKTNFLLDSECIDTYSHF